MRFIQAKHPAICWPLLPWFVEGNQTREEIFMELYGRLEQDPENTFVLIVMDDDICQGIMIAYCCDKNVWLWQVRTRSPFDKLYPSKADIYEYTDTAFDMLFKWAIDKGKNTINAICSKKQIENLAIRRYGFKKNGKEIQRVII